MHPSKRDLPRRLAWVVLGAMLVDVAMAAGDYAVRNGTVAGGGGTTTAGPYRVVWTVGEAAMGTTSQGRYRVTSGYPATIGNPQGGTTGGRIFKDSFEKQTGATP